MLKCEASYRDENTPNVPVVESPKNHPKAIKGELSILVPDIS